MPYLTYSQLKQSAKMRIAPVMGRLMGAYAIYVGLSFVISEAAAVPALFGSLTLPFNTLSQKSSI